ncbi:MAG: insulinase family protein [Propionibacteriaceae bacterium]|nr:insulinase family protein [Propionibacteriaceae bacterium]
MTDRPTVIADHSWKLPKPMRADLNNGLQILTFDYPGQHIVAADLVIDLPLNVEPTTCEGIAELVADTLVEGTRSHMEDSFAQAVSDIGAELDARAGLQSSHLSMDVPASYLGQALSLMAEVVMEPTLADQDLLRAKSLRLAHIEQEYANPSSRAAIEFRKLCIGEDFRAARPNGGNQASVEKITPQAARAFHQDWYAPARATLVLAGDFASDPMQAAFEAFDTWASAALPLERQHPQGRPPSALFIPRPGSVQAEVRMGCFSIDRNSPDYVALQIGCQVLGGSFMSRLNSVLREELGYTYGAGLTLQPMRSGGLLVMQSSFRTEVAVAAIEKTREILDIATNDFTDDEISAAISQIKGSFPIALATADQLVGFTATLVSNGLDLDYPDRYLEAISQVSAEAASAAVRKYLSPDSLSLAVVGAEELTEPLAQAGWELSQQNF